MKKLLLSLVVSAATLSASAESAVFDFANPDAFGYTSEKRNTGVDYNKPLVSGDVTITCDTKDAASGGGMLRFWWPEKETTATDFRCSATGGKKGQTLTFTANGGTITKIEFSAAKLALKADPGTLGAYANKAATWEGDAKSVVFTTTDACTFNKITVTYSLGAAADLKPAGLAWSETAVTVTDDKIAEFVAPTLTNPNNLTVTYSSSDENVAEVSETGVVTLTGDTGTATIKAAFAGDDTYRAGEASYTITVKAAPKTVASVAETVKLAENTEFIVGYELTVAYVKGINAYAYTSTGEFMQLYGTNSYKEGDVIAAGWNGKYAPYAGTPEIKPIDNALPAAASNTGKAFEAKEIAATDVKAELVNHVIVIKNVVLAEATPATKTNFEGKVGDTSILFRNNFILKSEAAGTYNIKGIIQVFNEEIQVYPAAFELVSGGETPDPTVPGATIDNPMTVAQALEACTADGPNGVYVKGIVTKVVTEYSSQYKNVTFNIADVAGGTEILEAFRSKWGNDVTPTADNNPEVGATVILYGDLTVFNNKKELNAGNLIVKYVAPQASGIDEIEAEAAEAVYYNLQGVEVANPENGIYIVRRGNKVTKEVIR